MIPIDVFLTAVVTVIASVVTSFGALYLLRGQLRKLFAEANNQDADAVQKLFATVTALRTELEKLYISIHNRDETIDALKDEIDKLRAELEKRDKIIDDQNQTIDDLKEWAARLVAQVKEEGKTEPVKMHSRAQVERVK